MASASTRVRELRALEGLSAGKTAVHRLHPLAKLVCAFAFIVAVVSFGRYEFLRLAPYLFYPFVMMGLAELPYRLLLPRVLIALPFCLFAGVSNVLLDRGAAFLICGVAVSFGALSLATILLKTYLCVMAALILVATMPFTELTAQLRRLHVPMVFVMVFETTFRYVGVFFEEVHSMQVAYRLRSCGGGRRRSGGERRLGGGRLGGGLRSGGGCSGGGLRADSGCSGGERRLDSGCLGGGLRSGGAGRLEMRHMGSFVGQIFLRGFDRAERIHAAMRCRGYSLRRVPPARRRFRLWDAAAVCAVCVPAVVLRVLDYT